jgi:hypothetical protein
VVNLFPARYTLTPTRVTHGHHLGNDSGLTILQEIEGLKNDVKALHQKNNILQPLIDDLLLVRRRTLEEWDGDLPLAITRSRNHVAHGGHVLADLQVIEMVRQYSTASVLRYHR